MKKLLDFNLEELKQALAELGEQPYRAGQVLKWLHAGVPFSGMTNLSQSLRQKLLGGYEEGYIKTLEVRESADGTKKYLFELGDGNTVESVLMQKNYGSTVCISTQVGCRMGCAFCASGQGGLVRNLSAGEMLAQVIAANAGLGSRANNIVLMGMGEPLDNYDNVVKFLRLANMEGGLNIGMRGISLSTCGLTEGIYKLAEEGLPVTLCLSLHAATDEKRKQFMPTAVKYSIEDIIRAATCYFKKTGRRVIIEYAVVAGVNDGAEDAQALKSVLGDFSCHVNLIPLSAGDSFSATPAKAVHVFCAMLEKQGLSATVRMSMGADIEGACGQLRQKSQRRENS